MNAHDTHSPSEIRVMVVDDSAVIRSFLTRFIEEDKDMKVVMTAGNGEIALKSLANHELDVIVLDIEMPVMDGLTALPLILEQDPNIQVLVASTLTKENAMMTMKAFQAGAAECLAKPETKDMANPGDFKRMLQQKIRVLAAVTQRKRGQAQSKAGAADAQKKQPVKVQQKFSLRPSAPTFIPDAISIGSSTGGPQALLQFFKDLAKPLKQPVFITQHMPATFTAILAEHINKGTGLSCHEAVDGEMVQKGMIYVAPGDYHMTIEAQGLQKKIKLNQEPPENYCRPSVDPMLRSLTDVYRGKVLNVILTGMGADGKDSSASLVENGGVTLAQDEATSVVWGMPGAVAMAGTCTSVLPLGLLAKEVRKYADKAV